MKKITFILFFAIQISWAQVGIGTVTPQKELHIAGPTATIRIESLDAINNTTYNDGTKLAPAFVDGNGDITLGNGTGTSGVPSLNFLIDIPNFIPDNPYNITDPAWFIPNTGTVLNNTDSSQNVVVGEITTVTFTVPQEAIIEIKYGITMVVLGSNLAAGPPYYYVDFNQAVSMVTFIKVDIGNDGLIGDEVTKIYGQKSQYYATDDQGIVGYPYMNGQAYTTVPAGTHTLYFYGLVRDALTSYTSVGFGGAQDYLKIRVYN